MNYNAEENCLGGGPMIIDLAAEVGEFCVLRTDPQLPKLRSMLTQAILSEQMVTIDDGPWGER